MKLRMKVAFVKGGVDCVCWDQKGPWCTLRFVWGTWTHATKMPYIQQTMHDFDFARSVGSTKLNNKSSRSHAVLMIKVRAPTFVNCVAAGFYCSERNVAVPSLLAVPNMCTKHESVHGDGRGGGQVRIEPASATPRLTRMRVCLIGCDASFHTSADSQDDSSGGAHHQQATFD